MAEHHVQMSEPKHDIENADIDFWIHSDNAQLGHLHISRGGVDWFKGKSSVKKFSVTWERLRDLLEAEGKPKQAPKPKRKRK
jgi:hypothetical protein